nr:hypothetical protein CFP56_17289 [Quercus suber]
MVQSISQELAVTAVSNANTERVVGSEGTKNLGQSQSQENFQAVLHEIDEAIHGDNVFQNSKKLEMESSLNSDRKVAGLKGLDFMPGISISLDLSMDEDSCSQEEEDLEWDGGSNRPRQQMANFVEAVNWSQLDSWNKVEFGHVGRTIAELQKHLEWFELQPSSPSTIQDMRRTTIVLNC